MLVNKTNSQDLTKKALELGKYILSFRLVQVYLAVCLLIGMTVTTEIMYSTAQHVGSLEFGVVKVTETTEITVQEPEPSKLSTAALPVALSGKGETRKRFKPTPDHLLEVADIAVQEMKKFGIPASITLAQYHLESGIRNNKRASDLAIIDNNWFGMKYSPGLDRMLRNKGIEITQGPKRCNKRGKDCARYAVFESRWECFRAKSYLLTNSNYSRIKGETYIDWAKGLKKYNYATDPGYARKLIKLVDELGLEKFDFMKS